MRWYMQRMRKVRTLLTQENTSRHLHPTACHRSDILPWVGLHLPIPPPLHLPVGDLTAMRSQCHMMYAYSEHLNTACSLPLVPPCKAMLADMCEALCFKGMHQTSSTEKSAASLTLQCPRLGIP